MSKRRKKARPAAVKSEESAEQQLERLRREHDRLLKERASLETDIAILKKAEAFFVKKSE